MPKEIERKFLVDRTKLPPLDRPRRLKQGYIPSVEATIRVRIADDKAFLTLKGKTEGLSRSEFEYPIPLSDALAMLKEFCGEKTIEKKRYIIKYKNKTWELDMFEGANEGLVVAEVELESENEPITLPEWVTKEVTHDPRYRNVSLLAKPYKLWREDTER